MVIKVFFSLLYHQLLYIGNGEICRLLYTDASKGTDLLRCMHILHGSDRQLEPSPPRTPAMFKYSLPICPLRQFLDFKEQFWNTSGTKYLKCCYNDLCLCSWKEIKCGCSLSIIVCENPSIFLVLIRSLNHRLAYSKTFYLYKTYCKCLKHLEKQDYMVTFLFS